MELEEKIECLNTVGYGSERHVEVAIEVARDLIRMPQDKAVSFLVRIENIPLLTAVCAKLVRFALGSRDYKTAEFFTKVWDKYEDQLERGSVGLAVCSFAALRGTKKAYRDALRRCGRLPFPQRFVALTNLLVGVGIRGDIEELKGEITACKEKYATLDQSARSEFLEMMRQQIGNIEGAEESTTKAVIEAFEAIDRKLDANN